jgi:pimeloyl-ACP methyl ester carboxylesterase
MNRRRFALDFLVAGALSAEAGPLWATPPPPIPKAPEDVKPGPITYEDVSYPYPVSYLPLTMYGQDVQMAYMDVASAGKPNGRVVVLLHGRYFGGFYFGGPIDALRNAGYRVIVPDQIGFGRSSKPIMPYNFNDMALNTHRLLRSFRIGVFDIAGHDMGAALAARMAGATSDFLPERVVLCDPIGLKDIRYEPTRWYSTDDFYKSTMAQTRDVNYNVYNQMIRSCFPPSAWKPEYEQYTRILFARTLSDKWPQLAMVDAILSGLLYLDPVVYDWPHIKAKTLVVGGDQDGEDFPALARHAARVIPGAQFVLFPGVGHIPHIQAPEIFNGLLLQFLARA